jgi:hypothetical protein
MEHKGKKFIKVGWIINAPHVKIENALLYTFEPFCLCISDQQKTMNLLEDSPVNIPTKFGSNWPSGFREEDFKM